MTVSSPKSLGRDTFFRSLVVKEEECKVLMSTVFSSEGVLISPSSSSSSSSNSGNPASYLFGLKSQQCWNYRDLDCSKISLGVWEYSTTSSSSNPADNSNIPSSDIPIVSTGTIDIEVLEYDIEQRGEFIDLLFNQSQTAGLLVSENAICGFQTGTKRGLQGFFEQGLEYQKASTDSANVGAKTTSKATNNAAKSLPGPKNLRVLAGKLLCDLNRMGRVLRVRWHPLSDAHLGVLAVVDGKSRFQILDLSKPGPPVAEYSRGFDIQDVEDFIFIGGGKNSSVLDPTKTNTTSDSWNPDFYMSLHVTFLTKQGAILTQICPSSITVHPAGHYEAAKTAYNAHKEMFTLPPQPVLLNETTSVKNLSAMKQSKGLDVDITDLLNGKDKGDRLSGKNDEHFDKFLMKWKKNLPVSDDVIRKGKSDAKFHSMLLLTLNPLPILILAETNCVYIYTVTERKNAEKTSDKSSGYKSSGSSSGTGKRLSSGSSGLVSTKGTSSFPSLFLGEAIEAFPLTSEVGEFQEIRKLKDSAFLIVCKQAILFFDVAWIHQLRGCMDTSAAREGTMDSTFVKLLYAGEVTNFIPGTEEALIFRSSTATTDEVPLVVQLPVIEGGVIASQSSNEMKIQSQSFVDKLLQPKLLIPNGFLSKSYEEIKEGRGEKKGVSEVERFLTLLETSQENFLHTLYRKMEILSLWKEELTHTIPETELKWRNLIEECETLSENQEKIVGHYQKIVQKQGEIKRQLTYLNQTIQSLSADAKSQKIELDMARIEKKMTEIDQGLMQC